MQKPRFWDPLGTAIMAVMAVVPGVIVSAIVFNEMPGTVWAFLNRTVGVARSTQVAYVLAGLVGYGGVFLGCQWINYVGRRHPAVAVAVNAMGAEQALREGKHAKAAAYAGAAAIAEQQRRAQQQDLHPHQQGQPGWVEPALAGGAVGAAVGLGLTGHRHDRREQARAEVSARYDRQVADYNARIASLDSQHAAAMTAYSERVTAWKAGGQRGPRPQQPKAPLRPTRPTEPIGYY